MRLEDKVVAITGGGKGIGEVYTRRLAAEAARVVVGDLDVGAVETVAASVRDAGGDCLGLSLDVGDEASIAAFFARAQEAYGGIDVLINNAAIFASQPMYRGRIDDLTSAEWDRTMAVNVRGVFLCIKAAVPSMRARGGGSIINISSGTVWLGTPNLLPYVTSKAAVLGITWALARELGPDRIRINSITPGIVMSNTAAQTTPLAVYERLAEQTALKRTQLPEDLVGTVLYLASDDSAFVTGQTLNVDGGAVLR